MDYGLSESVGLVGAMSEDLQGPYSHQLIHREGSAHPKKTFCLSAKMKTSTKPPTTSNELGETIREVVLVSTILVVVFVFLRLWGRYRYKNGVGASARTQIGDHRLWVVLSDMMILVSLLSAVVLAIVACLGVRWGMGLHQQTDLSVVESENVLEMFYLYQIFYKFAAGISKVATCFLLLAISTAQMTRFNISCQILIVYIVGYSLSCSVATVFQCGLDFDSNWIHTDNQSNCFPKPPFWYIHAALNIFASIVIAFLPWWLFHYVTYSRKYLIASLMTTLAISEIVFGCVRLKGLYISAHSSTDMTYGISTGIMVSQLEVNFGIVAACIPTVLKILEEYSRRLWYTITGRENPSKSQSRTTMASNALPRSTLDTKKGRNDYARFGEDEEHELSLTHSIHSRAGILTKEGEEITVQTSFVVDNEVLTDREKGEITNNFPIQGQFFRSTSVGGP